MAKAPAKPKVKPTKIKTTTKDWPGAFGIYKESSRVVKFNLQTMLALFALILAAGLFGGGENTSIALVLLTNILTAVVSIALAATALAGARSKKMGISESVEVAFSLTGLKYIGVSILSGIIAIVSFLLLVVPFFFVLPRIILAPYFVLDKNLGPINALKESWAVSEGHSKKAWGVIGVILLFSVLMLLIIGFYFYFMYLAALALLYMHVTVQGKKV